MAKSDYLRRNVSLSVCLSVCLPFHPPAWNNSVPASRIFMKFDILLFLEKSVAKIQVSVKFLLTTTFRSWRSCPKVMCKMNPVI